MTTLASKYRGTPLYHVIYAELVTAARYRGVTTYQAIAQLMGLPLAGNFMGKEVGQIIGEISEDEVARGRPMLSAIVVGTSGRPGDGFYAWARDLGRLHSDRREDELRFWEQELKAVYETWKREFRT